MLQPVIQLGAAIHGKPFSRGALDRPEKLMHVGSFSLTKAKKRANALRQF
jgi:hypothetical protein